MVCSTPTIKNFTAPTYSGQSGTTTPPSETAEQQCAASGGHWYNNQCVVCPSGTTWSGTGCVSSTPAQTTQKPGTPGTPQFGSSGASGIGYNAFLSINFTAATGASFYDIIDPDSNETYASNVTGTLVTIPDLYAGAEIHLAVVAHNSAGSTQGGTGTFTLPCPNGYTAQGNTCIANQSQQPPAAPVASNCTSYESSNLASEVDICWNIESGVDHYLVRDNYGLGGGMNGSGYDVGYIGIAHLTGLPAGAYVTAQVGAVNSAGQVTWGNIVTMQTQSAAAAPSQSILAWDCSSSQPSGCIACCFSGVPSNAAEVTIQHVDLSGNLVQPNPTLADYVQGNSAQVCGLYPGGTETWQVQAYDDNGNLVAWSNIVQSTAQE